jgi:putative cell wall-binding protein
VVVLARGDDYADALAGVPLAYRLGAPISAGGAQPAAQRHTAGTCRLGAIPGIILGGTGAVSTGVANSLKNMGLEVERIAGRTALTPPPK